MLQPEEVALHEATRRRYLTYAMSVITSRALPDVRDGLKPVQRRILYAMFNNLRLLPTGRYRKCAAVVGEVMAKFHPHGDMAIYQALVRMAQPFALGHMLVDGQGNFGSIDGDNAAAMRYTECKLREISVELLAEIKQRTVDFRPTYDGQAFEPIVLPARYPNILVNGAEGIAVGMATRIPPHNLREVLDAAVMLIDKPDATVAQLCRKLKGPDFPTGGVILDSREAITSYYESGGGSFRCQGTWRTEKVGRKHYIIIDSIPYGVDKSKLVGKIGELVGARRLPQVQDVRDESTEDIRIALELRKPQDAQAAMAYLFKKTPLQQTYPMNLTMLVPTANPELAGPGKLDLQQILRHWLDFRFDTTRRRFEFELDQLRERLHILEGFALIFVDMDEAVRLIRESEGKRDAAERLIERFGIDDLQADAILELRLYRLAKLEILAIEKELEEKRARAEEIEALLASDDGLWACIRDELKALRKEYGIARRTKIGLEEGQEVEFSEDAYIVAEDTFVIVTRDGWVKRQSSFSSIDKIRTREGDSIGWLFRTSTRSTVAFFSDDGTAFVIRASEIPSTTGYGEPIQRFFNFQDGARVAGVVPYDPRQMALVNPPEEPKEAQLALPVVDEDAPPSGPYGIAVSRAGRTLRFALSSHADVSTRSGRRYMRLSNAKDAVVAVYPSRGGEMVSIATRGARALCFPVEDAKIVRGAGKGVLAIKLRPTDAVFAFELTEQRLSGALVKTAQGREVIVRPSKFTGRRAGKGAVVLRRGGFVSWEQEAMVSLLTAAEDDKSEDEAEEVEDLEQVVASNSDEAPEGGESEGAPVTDNGRSIPVIYNDEDGED